MDTVCKIFAQIKISTKHENTEYCRPRHLQRQPDRYLIFNWGESWGWARYNQGDWRGRAIGLA